MTVQDNIVTNFNKIAYTSYFDTDKIVAVVTGSVVVPSVGSFAISYQAVDTGAVLSGKCFTQMIWSTDSGVTWQDGDAFVTHYSGGTQQDILQVTCYSTATKIFVVVENEGLSGTAPAYIVQYKVIASSIT